MPATPHIVGYQCAGTIRRGRRRASTDRHVGQRVVATMLWGSHAELVVDAGDRHLADPRRRRHRRRARACRSRSAPPTTACSSSAACRRARPCSIQAGAGGVGIAAIQLAKRAGATVLATASSDERLDARCGRSASTTASTTRRRLGRRGCARPTDGRGVDLVVDSVGGEILQGSLACLAYRGRCITVGSAGRDRQAARRVACSAPGNQSLTGVFLGAEIATPRAQADDRAASSTTSPPGGSTSSSTAPSRSPRPPPPTRTSRAARPSAGSC